MTFIHWAKEPVDLNRTRIYEQGDFKPNGIWFEVDGDWKRWCDGEEFGKDRFVVPHALTFDDSRILHLRNARDIDRFTQRHAVYSKRYHEIDWKPIADAYSGIIISPYCGARRMAEHTLWYYCWDCASGCIWDLSIIKSWEVATVAEGA